MYNVYRPVAVRNGRQTPEPKFGIGGKRVKMRAGIGTPIIATVALVVVIVVAAGAYFALSGASSKSNTTTTSSISEQSTSTTTGSSSTSSVTTSTTSTGNVTSTSSTSKVTTQSSTSKAAFAFSLTPNTNQFVLAPGDSTNNLVLTINPVTSGSETVSLTGTVSGGLGVSFEFPSVALGGGQVQMNQIFLSAPSSEHPGNYTLNVTATSGNQVESTSIQVRVVQHLVYLSYYAFNQSNVTVPKGSTVYFYNTDAPHSWCGESDSGDKTIMFTSIVSTTSPVISSFSLWSITLAQGGTYTYMDTEHTTSGTGTIVVA